MSTPSRWSLAAAGVALLAYASVFADEPAAGQAAAEALPEGSGLAANYPGDRGIEADPGVVFVENFEQDSLEAVNERWESVRAPERMSLSDETPPDSGGRRSLRMTHVGGEGDGGHLYRRLLPGYDKLHVRFYVRFDPQCAPIHHFFHVGGYRPPTPF
ncbi:MAG TPA: hypothetical protein VML55_25200, partial [Planctomycetaceae bacterium]|nr:hypothetical protein [Planctomycetaceae bacterium]